ncbi:MAG: ABC transporter permease [Gammaproteobacteria bacterium WSBS_2016_MAG_OTU1]
MNILLGYEARFLAGLLISAGVAIVALAIALTLGLLGATAKTSSAKIPRHLAQAYTAIVRGIPEILFILLVYFDLQRLLNVIAEWVGIDRLIISPFWAGAIAIGIFYGAYMTETFRGALLAVARGQYEAAASLGLSRRVAFWKITFPQMLRHALPGIRNNWQVLLKATALISVIGLSDDMMAVAAQGKSKTGEPFLFYVAAAVGYLFLTAISGAVFNRIEKYARRGLA